MIHIQGWTRLVRPIGGGGKVKTEEMDVRFLQSED